MAQGTDLGRRFRLDLGHRPCRLAIRTPVRVAQYVSHNSGRGTGSTRLARLPYYQPQSFLLVPSWPVPMVLPVVVLLAIPGGSAPLAAGAGVASGPEILMQRASSRLGLESLGS